MKKQFLIILVSILSFNCYSQIYFEKGYYIDSGNHKTNCLIKNIDWKNNPTEFEYKLSEAVESKMASVDSIKEFGFDNGSKFVRVNVNIDRSTKSTSDLNYDRNPDFNKEKLFLKVLVEGKANLYEFVDGTLKRYFFNKNDSAIEQLIFKSYLTSDNKIGENNRFKNQLWINLKCSNFKINKVENLDYKKEDLVDYFVEYNKCNGGKNINYLEKQKKDLFNLSIRPGLNNSSLIINNELSNNRDADFDNEFSFRFGIEAEFIMPFNRNKWSLIVEPTYQYYSTEKVVSNQDVKVDYKSIELPIGVRHYLFLNENDKIFVNGSFIFDFNSNSIIDFSFSPDLEISALNNLAFGIGYKHNDKYSLELRYQTRREILSRYVLWNSDYRTMSIILGYSLF